MRRSNRPTCNKTFRNSVTYFITVEAFYSFCCFDTFVMLTSNGLYHNILCYINLISILALGKE